MTVQKSGEDEPAEEEDILKRIDPLHQLIQLFSRTALTEKWYVVLHERTTLTEKWYAALHELSSTEELSSDPVLKICKIDSWRLLANNATVDTSILCETTFCDRVHLWRQITSHTAARFSAESANDLLSL